MTRDAGVSLRIAAQPQLVAGLPQWLLLRLRNESTSKSYGWQRPVGIGDDPQALNITVSREGDVVAHAQALGPHEQHGGFFIDGLGPGHARTFLLDLEAIWSLPPGEYRLAVEYVDAAARTTTSLFVGEPTEAEARLSAQRPEACWRDTILERRSGIPGGPDASSVRAHEHLRLYAVVQSLLWAANWDDIDPTIFDRIGGVLEGPAAALRYELAALGGPPVSRSTRAETRSRWPDLEWWLDEADRQAGLLKSLQALRA